MRRGVRFPQWWMLLVAILSIMSGQGSLVGMERFAKRHRQTHRAVAPSGSCSLAWGSDNRCSSAVPVGHCQGNRWVGAEPSRLRPQ